MSWSISVNGQSQSEAREKLAEAVGKDLYAPHDGRLEQAADQILHRMAAGRPTKFSTGWPRGGRR